MTPKRRIAIVGAGPGGLSAAFHLTDRPGWSDEYEVDVYQLGWRVGGKGSTGRNPDAYERLQEHGIHLFGNMYYNSLRMLKACYEQVEWDSHDRFRTIDEAFLPCIFNYNTDYWDGRWHAAVARFPDNDAVPWEGDVWPDPRLIVQGLLTVISFRLGAFLTPQREPRGFLARVLWWIRKEAGDELAAILAKIGEHLARESADPRPPHPDHHDATLTLLGDVVKLLEKRYLERPDDPHRRFALCDLDLPVTILRGIVEDRLAERDIDSIDDENYRDWLARHGATETTLASTLPQVYPNVSFGYEAGDTTKVPTMAASAYVTFFLRQVIGKGAGGYFFAEGTGETVMKPLYRLLVQRGVRIHFFHKLTEVVPAADRPVIERLVFDVQATPRADGYDPLRRTADGELVWPDRPLYDQLVEGEALRESGADVESWWTPWRPAGTKVLEAGRDFDEVVLATPVATLRHTCRALMEHPQHGSRWTDMVERSGTSATQSVQLWLDEPTSSLGWDAPKFLPTDRYVGPLYAQDLTSFCDFTDLIEQERWPADRRPKGLVYFIGNLADPDEIPPLEDHDFPRRENERVKWATVQYLRAIDGLLPGAATSPVDPRSFDFDLLFDHDAQHPGRGVNRMAQQYWRANIDPNERYTLSLPGTLRYRMEAWGSGFENLALAGDWIYTGFNVGSFEGAVMGGKLASHALTGSPSIEEIYGYTFMHRSRQSREVAD